MKVSLSRAARLTGKSKSTISNAIKTGRLSADRGDGGIFEIDLSELQRVFVLVDQHVRKADVASKASTTLPSRRTAERPTPNTPENAPDIVDLKIEIARLTERLEARDDKINDMSKTLEELRYERDDYRERFLEADQKLIGVLNNQPSASTNKTNDPEPRSERPLDPPIERVDVRVDANTITSTTPSAKDTEAQSVGNPLMLSKLWRVFGKD